MNILPPPRMLPALYGCLFSLACWAGPETTPEAVSPGGIDRVESVSSTCPTFSWTPVDDALGYELAVFPVGGNGEVATSVGEAVLLQRLPAGASSWTPPGTACLDAGAEFAWAVRAIDEQDDGKAPRSWSSPRFMSVPALPSAADINAAVSVLRSAGLIESTTTDSHQSGHRPATKRAPSRVDEPSRHGVASAIGKGLPLPDRVGVSGSISATNDVGVGVQGSTDASGDGSAGIMGTASQGSGEVHGVIGTSRSRDGSGGHFRNTGGGLILSGEGDVGQVFAVNDQGRVSATSFDGDGSQLESLDWGKLDNVPAGFADGIDNDSMILPGTGVTLDGDTLSVTHLPRTRHLLQQLIAGTTAAEEPAINIGIDGLPVIAYYEANAGSLNVVHCSDPSCLSSTIVTVDDTGIVGLSPDIVIGRDGFPLISYYDDSNNRLKLAVCLDVACQSATLQVIDSDGDVGRYTSITTNEDGYPFIVYSGSAGVVRAARCLAINCSVPFIDTVDSGLVGAVVSVTRSTTGNALISYFDAGNGALKMAHCFDMECDSPTLYTVVDDTGVSGVRNAITLSADGRPVILHTWTSSSGTSHQLRIARCEGIVQCNSPDIHSATGGGFEYGGVDVTLRPNGLVIGSTAMPVFDRVIAVTCESLDCANTSPIFEVAGGPGSGPASDSAITVGTDGLPIIAWSNYEDGGLYVTRCSNTFCQPFRMEN